MDFSHVMLFGGGTLFVAGVMSVGAAVLNVDAFFEHPTAQPFVRTLGRDGARIFYAVLGAVFGLIGVAMLYRGIQIVTG